MKKLFPLSAILIFMIVNEAFDQPLPIKYGKIDTALLKLTVYEKDPTAAAVVLCDYGNFDANNFTFTRHMRLKIFKKEGAWFVNQLVYTSGKSTIKGCTYNYVDGEVVETKLRDESIFRERIRDDYERFRVTMPEVVDGSIVELYYSFQGLPYEWHFQRQIPVEWSELRIPSSPYFSFNKVFFGFEPLYINTNGRWVGKDMPALLEEPYISSIDNYLTKLEIELADITFPGLYRNFTTSWKDVNRVLMDAEYFGSQIKDFGLYLTEAVKTIKENYATPKEQLIAAHNYVKKEIKWNSESSLYASNPLSVANKNKSGNAADVNMILIKLLKKLDFDVYPVALSTRDNGYITLTFPTIQKLNYLVALVILDGEQYMLDATDEKLPVGLLPERCLNGNGRIIDNDKAEWIDLSTERKSKQLIFADLLINGSNEISGKINFNLYDYEALSFREAYEKFSSQEEYIADYESKYPGLLINNINLNNLDSVYKPVSTSLEVTLENQVDALGDDLSLNPMLIFRMSDSPFKNETRKYPVDYTYPRETRYVVQIKIPEGYTVSELPKPTHLVMPDKKASFKYNIMAKESTIQLMAVLLIDGTIYTEAEYLILREFYNQIIAKQSETVILKKTTL